MFHIRGRGLRVSGACVRFCLLGGGEGGMRILKTEQPSLRIPINVEGTPGMV